MVCDIIGNQEVCRKGVAMVEAFRPVVFHRMAVETADALVEVVEVRSVVFSQGLYLL